MMIRTIITTVLCCSIFFASGQSRKAVNVESEFMSYFTDDVMRYDFNLNGGYKKIGLTPVQIKIEGGWGGSESNLVDSFDYGTIRFRIFDSRSGKEIYKRGFSPLFKEWQTTALGKEVGRSYYSAVSFPTPRNKFKIQFEERKSDGTFWPFFSETVDPSSYFIIKENPIEFGVDTILYSGDPNHSIDLAFVAEGYTEDQLDKFSEDVKRLTDTLFTKEPFASYKGMFNIYAVRSVSEESGTDIPTKGIYKNTIFNTSYSTFDVDRYLTTSDLKPVYDAAANVTYDHICLLINSEEYGGGGFYNYLTLSTVDHDLSGKVFVHEFGHGFAGLADEYYTSDVAYEDYYDLAVEPWEPNITTLVNFDSKWSGLVKKSTPVPTPRTDKYSETVGVFEGGGYLAKGIYSPAQDCRMKSNNVDGFCPACVEAIRKVILSYR